MPVQHPDSFRQENMDRAGAIFKQCLTEYGENATEYIVRTLFMSWFATLIVNDAPPNIVMAEFDRRVADARERLNMMIRGELQNGELGPGGDLK